MSLDRDLEKLLDAIEVAEYPLLAWGITNGSMSNSELRALILENLPDCDVEVLKAELLRRGLIFETPSLTYRSRISELLRLTVTLRQWFPGTKSDSAPLLIHDTKFQLRPRSFPKRDLSRKQVVEILKKAESDINLDFIDAGLPDLLSKFQLRSIKSISTALARKENASIVISSGTGSGKTSAYFIPMFNWLSNELKVGGHVGVRTLALYPRVELLKDQLNTALSEARKINQVLQQKSLPTIRIGVWYGDTPEDLSYFQKNYMKNWIKQTIKGQVAWSCPFLRCQACADQPELILFEKDFKKASYKFYCSRCDFVVSSDEIVWTRDAIENKTSRCDVLFTTTESINRQLGSESGDHGFGLHADSKLQSILVDEAHIYDGLNGAQHAYLFRRLRNRVKHPLAWVSLSATLENPTEFIYDLIGLESNVIEPNIDELEFRGADYVMAARHYLESKKSPLSSAIQLAMLLSRMLDPYDRSAKSEGQFGSKLFVFGDKHDVVNRLYYSLADAEGYQVRGGAPIRRAPASLATLRSSSQPGLAVGARETDLSRYDNGQWWKASEELGHVFLAASSKKIGLTSSQQTGVNKNADVIVSTSSLEVGFDDVNVGAVLQYKTPPSSASFLQRKGRAGRTQKMRPIMAIVLSPFGIDRATWTNAENRLFVPRLPARRLPLTNRYTQKMQGTYALLDWLHSHAGVTKSWSLLSGKHFQRARSARSIEMLSKLLNDSNTRNEFAHYLSEALLISPTETEQVLWSMPRGILSTVVPTALRRLESSFSEDANQDFSPLKEFVSSNLFSELHIPEVDVVFPLNENKETETLPIQRVLREFIPGNISRHFGGRFWVPVPVNEDSVDVVTSYNAIDTGIAIEINDEAFAMYRPTKLLLETAPFNLNDSTSTLGTWGTSISSLGSPLYRKTGIECWNGQTVELEAYLHSRGTYVNVKRYVENTQGWTSPKNGDPVRIESKFRVGEDKVVLGFDLNVDGIRFELKRPSEYPPITSNERSARLMYLLKNEKGLNSKSNIFDLERVARSLIQMILSVRNFNQLEKLSDEDFRIRLLEISKLVLLDQIADQDQILQWLGIKETGLIRKIVTNVFGDRDSDWQFWFDERLLATLGTLILDAFRIMIPDLDSDDLSVDVVSSTPDASIVSVWISEVSSGGNGSIERIVTEMNVDSKFELFVRALLKPREFESLDRDLRKLNDFAISEGLAIANEVRLSWAKNLQDVEKSVVKFHNQLEKSMVFASRSSISVFVNRLLGPGSKESIVQLASKIASKWDADEQRIGLEIPPEVVGLIWKDDQSIDEILHLVNPSPARRAAAVSSFMWTRSSQGVELDYEVMNPFNFEMSVDVSALRKMMTVSDNRGNFRDDREIESVDVLDAQELLPIEVEIVTGNAVDIRLAIISATVVPVEDDAILVYRRVTEVSVTDDNFVAKLTTDLSMA